MRQPCIAVNFFPHLSMHPKMSRTLSTISKSSPASLRKYNVVKNSAVHSLLPQRLYSAAGDKFRLWIT